MTGGRWPRLFCHAKTCGSRHPILQILTVAELLDGGAINMPSVREVGAAYRRGARAQARRGERTTGMFQAQPGSSCEGEDST